ncbi:hypothetical protein HDV06_003769 [Boothiomyces sp. JEL0866]|nr:hypothetical protein HDV06_003769 [Boothiomyces sp. JEL0866]
MKFGEYLIQNVVPEWKHKYIHYNQLKHEIKYIELGGVTLREADQDNWIDYVDNTTSKDAAFIAKFHHQVNKAAEFLESKVQEARSRFSNIKDSCIAMEKHCIRIEDDIQINLEGSSQTTLENKSISFPTFTQRIVELKPRIATNSNENLLERSISTESRTRLENHLSLSRKSDFKKAKEQLKTAILEFYRFLELLSNFRVLNEMASQKILKKLAKRRNLQTFGLRQVAFEALMNEDIKVLLDDCLELYITYFDPNRRRAIESLKLAEQKINPRDIYTSGLFTGLSLAILLYVVTNLKYSFTVFVYAGLSLPILFLYLFALCLLIFQKKKINWILIFELDARGKCF